jgi:ferredoxin/flavodoxin---NADP+ reductase
MMEQLATTARPLRIAIIGAGPAGFYAAETLLKKRDIVLTIDIFNRFPTPFGLVRDGVAPDHQFHASISSGMSPTVLISIIKK